MKKVFLEYVWLDGNQPQQLRSKTKVTSFEDVRDYIYSGFVWNLPTWSLNNS